ncbi:YfgM family protein [Vibrio ulleungensis]|uniref:Ancillary SecYEG translocon subunit n=1 Tax=Vibrio ulleungensis TaxID=2807619 RepID=A0ABS2HM66_9VIBR|nr:tetratricopeptide repeat protein [Vibrio ulleungensis]MBM7038580.1 tetratricopeptide repeat protein [Vibrio ulleungensis]
MEIYDDEEQQVEAIKNWWQENGKAIVVGAVVGLGGLFGWRYYQDSVLEAQEALSQQYNTISDAFAMQSASANEDALAFIEANKGEEYAVLASMQLAKSYVAAGELEQGLAQLELAQSSTKDAALKTVLTVRKARVMAELEQFDGALEQLATVTSSGWQGRVAEAKGDILLRQGNKEAAKTAYLEAQQSVDASQLIQLKLDDLAQ